MANKRQAALGFIFVTLLIDVIGLGIIIPVMPKLIMQLTGCNISDASKYGGWLTAAYAVMQFVFAPILGNLSDKLGRRPILLMSLFGLGIDYIFLSFAPTLALLFIGRIIAGAMGASFTTASAYIADISTPEKRAQNFGMIGVAFGVGFIIGPALGGFAGKFGVRVPFMVSAGLSLLNFVYGYFVVPESLSKEHRRNFDWKRANPFGSFKNLKRYPALVGLMVCIFLIDFASWAIQGTWTFYTIYKFNWNSVMIGISLTVVGLFVAIVQGGLIRIVIPKVGEKNSVYFGLLLWALGLVLFAFASQGWMMYVFLVPYCLGGVAGPALQGIMSNQVPANEQGELQGVLTSIQSVCAIIGPLTMTYLFYTFTSSIAPFQFPGAPMMMGAILAAVSILFSIKSLNMYHEGKKKEAVPAVEETEAA